MPRSAVALALLLVPCIMEAQPAPPLRPLVEELRIDGKAHEWKGIDAVRRGPAGHILVGEQLGKTIRVFSPAGTLVRSFGQRGQGPGEFINLSAFGTLGDSIWAGDGALQRLTFFDLSGNVLKTVRADSALLPPRDSAGRMIYQRHSWDAPIALHAGETALVAPRMLAGDADTLGHVTVFPYWRTTRRGRVIDTALTVIVENFAVRITSADGARRNHMVNPFPQRQQAGTSVNGRRLVVVDPSFTGRDAWTYAVRMVDETGRELYSRRFPFTRAPVPVRTVDSLVADLARRYRNYVNHREALPVPPSYPPVTRALVDNDGSVWLRGRDDPAGVTWTILDPGGDPVATVREPARTRFLDIDGGLWATERDEDDVESIVRYRLGSR